MLQQRRSTNGDCNETSDDEIENGQLWSSGDLNQSVRDVGPRARGRSSQAEGKWLCCSVWSGAILLRQPQAGAQGFCHDGMHALHTMWCDRST